jgi:hypothetical protein
MWQCSAEEGRVYTQKRQPTAEKTAKIIEKGPKAAIWLVQKILTFFYLLFSLVASAGNCFPLIIGVLPVSGLKLPPQKLRMFGVSLQRPQFTAFVMLERRRALRSWGREFSRAARIEKRLTR